MPVITVCSFTTRSQNRHSRLMMLYGPLRFCIHLPRPLLTRKCRDWEAHRWVGLHLSTGHSRPRSYLVRMGDNKLFGRSYVLFLTARSLGSLANTSLSVVIGWEVYEIARQSMSIAEASLAVGLIGLMQFLPLLALTLVAGEAADRHNRRLILMLCYCSQLLVCLALGIRSSLGDELWPIFLFAALYG